MASTPSIQSLQKLAIDLIHKNRKDNSYWWKTCGNLIPGLLQAMYDDKDILQETERMNLPVTLDGAIIPYGCISWLLTFWLISTSMKGYTIRYSLTRYGEEVYRALQAEQSGTAPAKHNATVKPGTDVCHLNTPT